MRQRVALLGASGQLGSALLAAWPSEWECYSATSRDLDLAEGSQLKAWLSAYKPTVVLNAAAYNGVDSAEKHPAEAHAINSTAIGLMGEWCCQSKAYIVTVSTDYVFPGHGSTAILENSMTSPLGQYGLSKEGGEQAFRCSGATGAIVRTSGLFGERPTALSPHNFLEKIRARAMGGRPFPVRDDLIFCPTWAPDLAAVLIAAARERLGGVIHATGLGQTTWYDWAFLWLEALGTDPARLLERSRGDADGLAKRPKFTVLGNSRDDIKALCRPLHWQEATKLYLQKTRHA